MSLLSRLIGRRPKLDQAAETWFQSVARQSRVEAFYRSGAVEDTFEGRFELTTLHGALVMRTLRGRGDDGRDLSQALFNRLFKSFDYALREIGTGDLTVGKKIRKLGEAFYGRARAYDEAFDAAGTSDELRAAFERNGLGTEASMQSLVDYVEQLSNSLENADVASLLTGQFEWPQPRL